MAKLTVSDVKHIALLSNLTLTEAEIEKFTPQLEKIVDFIGQLSEVDTTDIEPTSQTTGLVNVLRDDEIRLSEITPDEALSGTDNVKNGYVKVPAILKGRTSE